MTKDKDLKRRIRARMEKTGESYTTARSNLLRRNPLPLPLPDGYATLAGRTDEVMRARTGKDWPEWVRLLDDLGAVDMPHGEIAAAAREICGLDWWSQTVAVGYERIRGLREPGQRRDGRFEANKSKTVDAPAAAVARAFTDARTRRRWLDEDIHVRGATAKAIRIDWPDGTDVVVGLTPKGAAKTAVAIQHGKLPSREALERMKAFWGERLPALKSLLED